MGGVARLWLWVRCCHSPPQAASHLGKEQGACTMGYVLAVQGVTEQSLSRCWETKSHLSSASGSLTEGKAARSEEQPSTLQNKFS